MVILHIAGWLSILLINLLDMDDMTIRTRTLNINIPMWIIYIALFYINYSILIPKLLFRKKTLAYIFSALLLLCICFVSFKTYLQSLRKETLLERIEYLKEEKKQKEHPKFPYDWELKKLHWRIDDVYSISQYNPLTPPNLPMVSGLLLVFATSMILRFSQRWKKEEKIRIATEKEHIASELEYLKQQINPHFLFNALNSIYSLTIPYSTPASNSILKLSSILRYMLYETNRKQVMLSDEISVIEDYIGLQELRLTPKTKVTFRKEGSPEGYKIEPLLLIPLIENAFKYGIDSTDPSFINISIKIENNRLIFETDNKIAVKKKENENSGIGIKNIRRRLELLYHKDFILNTYAKDNVFFVYFAIPLSHKANLENKEGKRPLPR